MKNHFLADYLQKAKETPLALNIDDKARIKDKRWFLSHDYRAYRLRPMTQKERAFYNGVYLNELPELKKYGIQFNTMILKKIDDYCRDKRPLVFRELISQKHPLVYNGPDLQRHLLVDQALCLLYMRMTPKDKSYVFCFTSEDLLEQAHRSFEYAGGVQ